MIQHRSIPLATLIVLGTGALWGFYWLPVRSLAAMGLPGAWGTVAVTAAAVVLLLPFALARRDRLAASNRVALGSIALGGAAFALYSIGFVYGRVAIIILLYFLTPVWSTLIGRYVMGWATPRLRRVAIVVGLAGLAVMLGAEGELPWPRGPGEWMALASGILWSVATTGIRARSSLEPVAAAFVFAAGALVAAVLLAPVLEPWPATSAGARIGPVLGLSVLTGGVWWGLSMAGLMWATVRLDPARVGILLMTEVLVGAASAALFAGELLTPVEIAGGALVLCAGVLEVWPTGRALPRRTR
ncbi:DMT family transporter [Sulfitobacter sabulilitoris]|uniref:DMT family transporter n=1 Tax=Sulfitobacter sabulilitoris TaxID=2562655 RepID=A0A5S3PJN8_9RHOB|nr:DMT family transporter [Sulfitobacter sabulilitoris]TMM54557.1 DMT family transporter [Sulfitobacter sabulilitoris]